MNQDEKGKKVKAQEKKERIQEEENSSGEYDVMEYYAKGDRVFAKSKHDIFEPAFI